MMEILFAFALVFAVVVVAYSGIKASQI